MEQAVVGDVTLVQLIVWILLGALVGSLVGRLLKRGKKGYGLVGNLIVGLIGALIGGFLFSALGIDFGSNIQVTLNDFIAALAGGLIFVAIVRLVAGRL